MWNRSKAKIKRMKGCHQQMIPSYLDEFMQEQHGRTASQHTVSPVLLFHLINSLLSPFLWLHCLQLDMSCMCHKHALHCISVDCMQLKGLLKQNHTPRIHMYL